jgi:DNA-binding IclR family transcriptional regulator
VRRDAALRFELGPACIVVGDAARASNPALRAAARYGEALARAQSSVTAVSIRDRGQTRVSDVFDFGPPLGLRAHVGEAIQLAPPFGASFVAWMTREDPDVARPSRPAARATRTGALSGGT